MKLNIKNYLMAAAATLLLLTTSCSVEPTFYSQVTPSTFYTSKDAVWDRFNRPFTHWRWYAGYNETYWGLQELGTDEFVLPTRGSDWYDDAKYQKIHHHDYGDHMWGISDGWRLYAQGVALALEAQADLDKNVDFEGLGFTDAERADMLQQMNVLIADFYLRGLDLFGGCTIYKSNDEEVVGRSTDVETFNHIDSLLKVAIPKLTPKQTLGAEETGTISQATAIMLQARLYFNAKSYIGKEMWNEAAALCQDVINGKYGKYSLDEDWTKTFGFDNKSSNEIIWNLPSSATKLNNSGYFTWGWTVPYNYKNYLGGLDDSGSNNGFGIQPGLNPAGEKYTFKLSGPYQKFNDLDVRKQNYVYEGGGKYHGMFIVGELQNPLHPEWICTGSREYARGQWQGKPMPVVDQCAYMSKYIDGSMTLEEVTALSDVGHAEENSCVRLVKRGPRPDITDKVLYGEPNIPVIRLAEAYYTLAECKMRTGDKAGAAQLINTVRKRYFEGEDPDPVTEANLDKYRMLDEWMMEFIGEARRRIDLVRWDAYATEDWWDHKATNNKNLNRFPIHYSTINANNKIEQNPGY